MAPSQLKRLKASLREQGIVGPQKSKKQKKTGLSTEQKVRRNAALETIRESFNPFEVKHLSRPAKRDVTTMATLNGKLPKGTVGRPGVTKSMGEQKRKQTLLLEVQTRNKVGGILDRRIGEDDPNMTQEEKALQRYTWEKQRKKKKGASAFDLENDDNDGEDLLTHGGRALDLDEDYDARSISDASDDDQISRKRNRLEELENGEHDEEPNGEPDRKKSRAEIMEEVVKKSKLHKFERQRAKEEDDEVRIELDKDLPDVRAALSAFQSALTRPKAVSLQGNAPEPAAIHPDRMAMLNGAGAGDASYDQQFKKIAQDQRARPSDRTRTEEEIAQAAAEKAEKLETERQKRMIGEDEEEPIEVEQPENIFEQEEVDDAADFGFKSRVRHTRPEGIDDEDDFLIEDDLIASASESEEEAASDDESQASSDDELLAEEGQTEVNGKVSSSACPRTIEELEAILDGTSHDQYHEIIRSIRIRYDISASPANKARLDDFSAALVQLLARLPNQQLMPTSDVIDNVIRHIHSMARKSPDPVAIAFKQHLRHMHATKSMTPGDLIILTAVGSIFPPSDHFHEIVTPAMLLIARWLGLSKVENEHELATGIYLSTLCIRYQQLAKRYIPEFITFTIQALQSPFSRSQLEPQINNLLAAAALWSDKSAFIEIFTPCLKPLRNTKAIKATSRLEVLLSQAQLSRRMLELHHHRPLAIKSHVPRFEEGFDPSKHYDPDLARSESQRLKKEYKKERKGAMRELRKDANFLAREKLREKKVKDQAYEEKYRRLVSEIQGEEGREKNAYDREKRLRKGKR